MYLGYNLAELEFNGNIDRIRTLGESINSVNKTTVRNALKAFSSPSGKIDGSKLQDHWFPQIHADVFISHSHKDESLAMCLAGWLKKTFGLDSFIDSCVWGYSDDLLWQVDKKFCLNPGGKTFCYKKRNGSTSHIHMMLSTALGMMIDNTECLIFLNTPNSLTPQESISKTESPWIYAEVAMTHFLRRKSPEDHRQLIKLAENIQQRKIAARKLRIDYTVGTGSLIDINGNILKKWEEKFVEHTKHPLDILYSITK